MSASRVRNIVAGVVLILIGGAADCLAKKPDIPLPDDARVSRIGQNMRVNGNNVTVQTFTTKESATDVINFYRDEWSEERNSDPGYTVQNLKEPWVLITRIEDGYLITIQVQPTADGGTQGLIGVSRLPDRPRAPKLGEGFPTVGGSQVLNEVVSRDPGQTGRTMWVRNDHDLRTNVDFYRDRYGTEGWSLDIDRSIGGVMHVLALRKGRKRVNLVLSETSKRGSQIVVNEVTHEML